MKPDHNENLLTERKTVLREKLACVPQCSGVYLHRNKNHEILYVGKAKNLNSRLRSYFTGFDRHSPKTRALVEKIADFDIIVTKSEYESLLLENNLIKHHKPPYNILLRDDKTYPYIRIDITSAWPRIVVTRRRKKGDGALYFGPYTLTGHMAHVIDVVNRFFPLIKCTPHVFKTVTRPCNYYDIKKCLGPCRLAVNPDEYRAHVDSVIGVLGGKTHEILGKIKREIQEEAKALRFEKAAVLRNQLVALEKLVQEQSVTLGFEAHLDVVGFYAQDDDFAFYVSHVRSGKVIGGTPVFLSQPAREPEEKDGQGLYYGRILTLFLCQFYQAHEIPEFVFFEKSREFLSLEQCDLLDQFLQEKEEQKKKDRIFFNDIKKMLKNLKDREKSCERQIRDLVYLAEKNAENKFQEQLRIDESAHHLLSQLQVFLASPVLPRRIECYDISTFQGVETVASQVVFKNGEPLKSDYRKYIIRDVIGQNDDFASLREVMRRRFREVEKLPDVLLIDGGTPQVREVAWVLKSLGLEHLCLVGIAKSRTQRDFSSSVVVQSSERLVIPRRDERRALLPDAPPEIKELPANSPLLHFVTRIRDEAHRVAIGFHRNRRDKSSLRSVLSSVSGLGPKRKKKLVEVYPDLSVLASADLQEVVQKTGIPLNVVQLIRNALNQKPLSSKE